MGNLISRLNNQLNNNTVEETETTNYKYPPKTGNFFSNSFIMGGEKFDQAIPESYLFGENSDLNWLGSKPISFPYFPPKNSPTKTLKSLVNIRKESVKFVKTDSDEKGYNIEFVFDADQKCAIRIYYFSIEETTANNITYLPQISTATTSETFYYQKGASQTFSQPSHIFNPTNYNDDDMQYNVEKDVYPLCIHCVIIDDGGESLTHSHSTICVVDHHTSDGEYHLRAMKQKIFVDGLCYLLQEIYGIENKNLTRPTTDEDEDNGSECVICICEPRDTLILPCRHLCLCNSCADSLRYQANNCPICRAPFRALLQIKAVQKSNTPIININPQDSTENIPMGYMPIPLIEALNGPGYGKRSSIDRKEAIAINKDDEQKNSPINSIKRNSKEKINGSTEQFRMSVLLSNEENSDLLSKRSPTLIRSTSNKEKKSISRSSSRSRDRDCVKYVNEKSASNDLDDDSEAEKLSPLLVNDERSADLNLRMDAVEDSVDDTDDDKADMAEEIEVKAEDSDYYTPEDPHTNILSPVKSPSGQIEKRDIVTALKDTELPDSPISGNSQISTRSSGGESYSSSSSTRQLLSSVPAEASKTNENQSKN